MRTHGLWFVLLFVLALPLPRAANAAELRLPRPRRVWLELLAQTLEAPAEVASVARAIRPLQICQV